MLVLYVSAQSVGRQIAATDAHQRIHIRNLKVALTETNRRNGVHAGVDDVQARRNRRAPIELQRNEIPEVLQGYDRPLK